MDALDQIDARHEPGGRPELGARQRGRVGQHRRQREGATKGEQLEPQLRRRVDAGCRACSQGGAASGTARGRTDTSDAARIPAGRASARPRSRPPDCRSSRGAWRSSVGCGSISRVLGHRLPVGGARLQVRELPGAVDWTSRSGTRCRARRGSVTHAGLASGTEAAHALGGAWLNRRCDRRSLSAKAAPRNSRERAAAGAVGVQAVAASSAAQRGERRGERRTAGQSRREPRHDVRRLGGLERHRARVGSSNTSRSSTGGHPGPLR